MTLPKARQIIRVLSSGKVSRGLDNTLHGLRRRCEAVGLFKNEGLPYSLYHVIFIHRYLASY